MTISAACIKAMVDFGVLMNGDQPAAADLLNLDTIKVGFIAAPDDHTKFTFPQNYDATDFITYLAETDRLDLLGSVYVVPNNMEDIVKKSLGYWYDGNVEFVPLSHQPDIQIISYIGGPFDPRGFASFPKNTSEFDNFKHYGGNTTFVGIDILKTEDPDYWHKKLLGNDSVSDYSEQSQEEIIYNVITHEFAHALGITHPEDALKLSTKVSAACDEQSVDEILGHDRMSTESGAHNHKDTPYVLGTKDKINSFTP